jgi:hypothetical protein
VKFLTLSLVLASFLPISALANPAEESVVAKTRFFMESLQASNLAAAGSVFDTNEINWFGRVWMKTTVSREVLRNCLGHSLLPYDRIDTYSFDDCLSNKRARSFVLPAFRVFDDQSILSVSYSHQWTESTQSDSAICLIFKRRDLDWRIVSIVSVPWFKIRSQDNDSSIAATFKRHRLFDGRVLISIPPVFKRLPSSSSQVDFSYLEDSVQSAVYSMNLRKLDFSSAPRDLPDPLFTFSGQFFENLVAKQGTVTDRVVRFYPNGYWIEAKVSPKDDEASNSITVIVRIPDTDQVVWIQFFAYEGAYRTLWREVDLSLRSLQVGK